MIESLLKVNTKVLKFLKSIIPNAILILLCIYISLNYGIVIVNGQSMSPTYTDYDAIFVKKNVDDINPGDIVVVNADELRIQGVDLIIKRVIAMEGDTVSMKNGTVYVNNQKLKEDYVKHQCNENMEKITVGENEVFIMGDNRDNSLDSRDFGTVSKDKIESKIIYDADWFRVIGHIRKMGN